MGCPTPFPWPVFRQPGSQHGQKPLQEMAHSCLPLGRVVEPDGPIHSRSESNHTELCSTEGFHSKPVRWAAPALPVERRGPEWAWSCPRSHAVRISLISLLWVLTTRSLLSLGSYILLCKMEIKGPNAEGLAPRRCSVNVGYVLTNGRPTVRPVLHLGSEAALRENAWNPQQTFHPEAGKMAPGSAKGGHCDTPESRPALPPSRYFTSLALVSWQ